MNTPVVLDCTLRDGGYYNAWDFSAELCSRYFRAVDDAGVDVVELGFRQPNAPEFLGPWAYTADAHLRDCDLPRKAALGVMCNASDLVADPTGTVDSLFAPADTSPVEMVRIASHFGEVDRVRPALERLVELGYRVGFNLMQASVRPTDEVRATAARIAEWDLAEVLYFADSLGNMDRDQVGGLVEVFAQVWDGDIGVHTHDNRGRALDNTLAALDAGARWVDATVLGMGRGAGNCRTDFLLFELAGRGQGHLVAEALLNVTEIDFRALQRRHGWGTNLLYFKSAAADIHPSYVQFMQADSRYDWPEMVDALDRLPGVGGLSFRTQNLDLAAAGHESDGPGRWDASGWAEDRDVLIVGPGPTARSHAVAIESHIRATRPLVLCLNTTAPIDVDLVDAYVACHPTRILFEAGTIADLDRPLLAPARLFASVALEPPGALLDYGLTVDGDRPIEIGAEGCVLPSRLALGYALAAATAAGARRISLVGMDGYSAGDPRQEEVVELLGAYEQHPASRPVVSLTPTTYPVTRSSVYAPQP